MAGRLHGDLVELVALVGMDADSGLKPVSQQPPPKPSLEEEEENGVFNTALEPQVLAAVSGHLAIYPFKSPRQDDNYPPKVHIPTMGLKKRGQSQPSRRPPKLPTVDSESEVSGLAPAAAPGTPGIKRRISRRISFTSMARKPPADTTQAVVTGPTELPVSHEVLNSLGTFCFPDYAYGHRQKVDDHAHFLVLTDITGVRSYATCLTFYRPFIIRKNEEGASAGDVRWRCSLWPKADDPDLEEGEELAYLPACLVLISRHPYFTTMKDCLSRLVMRINMDPEDINMHLKDFALQLTMTPCPPAGRLALNFMLDQVVFTLQPPSAPYRPVVDIPLNLIFECFPLATVLRLVAAMLTQTKIIFVASSYALLTVITESLLTFIQPFHWWLPYVPVLSQQLLELVDAPGTFIMGCHSSHKHQIEGVEGLIVADINSGELRVCKTLDVPVLPPSAVHMFEDTYHRLQCHFDVFSLERRSAFMYEDMRAMRQEFQRQFNHDITQAFLHLMVGLFRDIIPYLKIERRFFHSDRFLECLQDSEKPFYQKVIQTDMFHQFLKDRFALKSDYWSELEEQLRPLGRNSIDMDRGSPMPSISRRGSLLTNSLFLMSPSAEWRSFLTTPTSLPSLSYLTLPNFIRELYTYTYEKMIIAVNEKLEESRGSSLRGSLLYLRGTLRAASGHPVSALEDFYNTGLCDARLFPTQVVTEILHGLSDLAKDSLYVTPFYQKSEQIQNLLDSKPSNSVPEQRIIMDFDKIPRKHVDAGEFAELVGMLEIINDHDSITRLFEALTLSNSRTLDPETFELFYECWKETEMQLGELSIPELKLEASECFLKASNMIKTSVGTGRIALTQKRLIFLREGSDSYREIIKLRDIKTIEKVTMTSFLNQIPAIRITPKGQKVSACVVWLKEARDAWYMMLHEIWSGKLISEELRDPAIVQQAAHNVLLLDAVLQSGQEPYASHSSGREKAAAHMCYFTRRREQGVDRLPPETKDVLQHRVDPNVQQAERRAVEALLYTAGNRSSSDEDQRPRLWCGMADGKLRVFDASTWLLEPQHFQAKDRIVCLVAVGDIQVWAGSFDSSIYIIDTRTKSCKQSLFEHTDMVCGMTVVEDQRAVYSASLNGEILRWNMDTLQLMSRISLPDVHSLRAIEYHNNQLWCCCGSTLVTVTLGGEEVSRAVYMEGEMAHQIDCFLITPQEEVWLGCGRRGEIAVLALNTLAVTCTLKVPCRGISKMVQVQDKVWVGSKGGKIYIYNTETHKQEKCLKAHSDAIRSLCSAQSRYVMSGAGSHDGKVAIWRTSAIE